MDDKVVQRLKLQKGAFDQSLDDFKRALLRLARAELPEAHFHSDHAERFDLDGQTYTTEWPLADDRGWAFFRLGDGRLADELVRRAKDRDLPEASLQFDLAAYSGNLADIPPLRGKSGWMQVSRITLTTPARTYDDRLATYASQNEVRTVHPFMLVVTQDTDHARRVRTFLESDGFFDGRYKGRVAEIHSKLTGEESDENAQRLLNIERTATPTS